MRIPANGKRYNYDIFISHNRVDKEWVRVLADRLAKEQYNGRPLRPWLDERFLDPGNLGSESELTTAMDRSRFFGLVVSPEAMVSKWVEFELRYFLGDRDSEAVVPILRRACPLPTVLHDLATLDFSDEGHFEAIFKLLIARLCPVSKVTLGDVERGIDAAFEDVVLSDPGGFSPGPTRERDVFFNELALYDIDDAVSEGLAVTAFDRAAEHLLDINAYGYADAVYNYKMLLGECLAAALNLSANYRQVAQRFLDIAEKRSDGSVLMFVVARAYSKLAEIDLRFVDVSVLLRVISLLDTKQRISNEEQAIQGLLARTVGKIRGTSMGEFMIKTLSEGSRTSRIVAAGAISLIYAKQGGGPVFYLSELERLYESQIQQRELLGSPPSRKLLSLLFGLDLHQDESVRSALRLAKDDLQRFFPDIDFPYGFFWPTIRNGIKVTNLHHAPFMGTVVKATLRNMVELADNMDVSRVACLTEPRIVDALFDNCGALLLLQQDPNSHQCRRLRDRGVPFGMLSQEMMSELADGDHIVVDQQHVSIQKGSA